MGDEHLSIILETESDEVIKSSVEDLVPIPSEFEGILDNMCDVPFSDENHSDAESDLIESLLTQDTLIVYSPKNDSLLEEFAGELAHIDPIPLGINETDSDPKDDIRFIEQLLYDDTSSEDDSFEDIDYVEASPLDSKLVSLEEVKDEILRAKLFNIHLLIDKIDDHTEETSSGSTTTHADNSLLDDHMEEMSSGSTITHADNSLPEYDSFLFETEPDQGELSSVAIEAIFGEPRVYVPNVLPTYPTLYQDLYFSSFNDSLGSGLEVSFPSETRNKMFDPGIFIKVQSNRLLSRENFSISFIRDPLYPVFDTLLEDKVFKPCILSYLLVSHRDKTTFDFSENPMMMISFDLEDLCACFQSSNRAISDHLHVHIEVLSVLWGNRLPIHTVCGRCLGGGWTNWKMTRHHGTVAFVRGQKNQYEVRSSVHGSDGSEKSVQGLEKRSILEADVAQCDWWIKNNTAANDEI
nr:hypothetical protein [Tanacetum cinerariifolium]